MHMNCQALFSLNIYKKKLFARQIIQVKCQALLSLKKLKQKLPVTILHGALTLSSLVATFVVC